MNLEVPVSNPTALIPSHTELLSIESNTINHMDSHRQEAMVNYGAEYVLNPDGKSM
jgi:hypothetical protein